MPVAIDVRYVLDVSDRTLLACCLPLDGNRTSPVMLDRKNGHSVKSAHLNRRCERVVVGKSRRASERLNLQNHVESQEELAAFSTVVERFGSRCSVKPIAAHFWTNRERVCRRVVQAG